VLAGLVAAAPVAKAEAQEPGTGDTLTLAEAVARAQQTHPSVGAARAGEVVAQEVVGRATSRWWPQIGGQAAITEYSEPMLVAPLHGFDSVNVRRIEFEKTLLQGNVSLAWTVFDGARVNRIRGARAGAAGAAATRTATEMALTTEVAVAYLKVLSARGVLDATERRIASLRAERQRVDQFLAEGRAARVELLRVDAALAQAEAELVANIALLDLAERDLARLIGLDVEETRVGRLVPLRFAESARLDERSILLEAALANSPEVERARQRLASAKADHRIAKAIWIPKLDLNGGYQAFSSDAGNTSSLWNVGFVLSYPLFTGGARSKEVAQARATAEAVGEEFRLTELRVSEGVDRALNLALETDALVESLTRAVTHQAEVVRIEQLSLDAGAGTQTDYLRAEADLTRARALLVEAQHAEIAAWVELARVTGELTPEWLGAVLENAR
jgi:outer membrane protein TolC